MDANDTLKEIKSQLETDKKELEQVDILIKTLEDAGDPVSELKAQQTRLKTRIEKWQKAISKNVK